MEDKLEILEKWENDISDFRKIRFEEAKKIYQIIQQEPDKEKSKYLRKELINGTLYNVLNFVKNNGFICLNSSYYNIEGIITCSYEIFISKIDKGILMQTSSYKEIFNLKFYSEILEKLGINKLRFQEDAMLNIDVFIEIIDWYIKQNNNLDITYEKFIEFISEKYKHLNYFFYGDKEFKKSFVFLKYIYYSLEENKKLTKTKLNKLKYLIIDNGYEYMKDNIDDVIVEDSTENIINKIYIDEIMGIIFDTDILSEREKNIIKKRFGIYNSKRYTYDEIAKKENVTRERIRQIEAKSIRKLRRNSTINNLYKNKGENI